MVTTIRQHISRLIARAPYPLALQSLITLVLLATLPSALAAAGSPLAPRFALRCLVVGLHGGLCWLLPVRRRGFWWQLAFLVLQVGAAALAHLIVPSQLLGYVYLVIVLQAVYLFKPYQWIIFACCTYVAWSGSLIALSTSLLDWASANLVLAFPGLCILIAAAVYARQHQRHEHVQQLLLEVQHRYETLTQHLRDAQQGAAIEERSRLAQAISTDITIALTQLEQNIASAISQAQTSFARFETTVAQTRTAAAATIDRMRATVTSLRMGVREDEGPPVPPPTLTLPPDELMTMRSQRTLTWLLPIAFVGMALPLALLQHMIAPPLVALFVLCCASLVGGYIFTQRMRNPLLVQVGLAGQTAAVIGMALISQVLPLLLGLLLVIWQVSMRLSTGQIVAFLISVQALIGLMITRLLPLPDVDSTQLLIFSVTCVAVVGLVGPARRELGRRRQAEARLTQLTRLTHELEQQVNEVRTLAKGVERTRLAREMHDDLGHKLMVLNVQLQCVEALIEEDPAVALEQLCSTRGQLHHVWASVFATTDSALALDSTMLLPALNRLIDDCRTLMAMPVTLRVIGNLAELTPQISCTVFRAVQEALTNAHKYARTQPVRVLISCDDAELRVYIQNDGGDHTPAAANYSAAPAGHFGLLGLRERADLLGGSIEAGPLAEGGFALTMIIPMPWSSA